VPAIRAFEQGPFTLDAGADLRHWRSRLAPMAARRDRQDKGLGPLEAEVMERMWAAGEPLSVRQLFERLNDGRARPLAYTTVMTVMSRLAEKGALGRRPQGRGYVYEVTATNPAGLAVRGVLRDFGDAAMAQFVEEARADPEMLERLQRLLAEEPRGNHLGRNAERLGQRVRTADGLHGAS